MKSFKMGVKIFLLSIYHKIYPTKVKLNEFEITREELAEQLQEFLDEYGHFTDLADSKHYKMTGNHYTMLSSIISDIKTLTKRQCN